MYGMDATVEGPSELSVVSCASRSIFKRAADGETAEIQSPTMRPDFSREWRGGFVSVVCASPRWKTIRRARRFDTNLC